MVEEEEYNAVFSALSHPLRRNILSYIVERGPQSYSELLAHFSLETGTLNYHLERMTAFLEQDDKGKYKSTNVGYAAQKLLGVAKTELSNPHAPPVGALSVSMYVRQLASAIFNTLFVPEQAFEDAQNTAWPFLLIGGFIAAVYLSFHFIWGYYTGFIWHFVSGVFVFLSLAGLILLSTYGIYRHRFRFLNTIACYAICFLPLTVWNFLYFLEASYPSLVAFLRFLLLAWAAYLFLTIGKEAFGLTMSQAFTGAALGLVAFFLLIQAIRYLQLFPLQIFNPLL